MGRAQFHARTGVLLEPIAHRAGAVEWRVRLADGAEARAIAYSDLTDELTPGQQVWLNTTAAELSLGTGGVHFILAPLPEQSSPGSQEIGAPPRRELGHLMKLRYTPLQHAVLAVEEETSPHHVAVAHAVPLTGLPVIAAELHSTAMAAAVAARTCGAERVVYVMTDGAALPLAFSRIAARLRSEGVLAGTLTVGQAFGGDLEAVTLASALVAARTVLQADVVVVAQGPGSAGTGTALGFSGLAQAEHLNTAAALGARPVAALRLSFADPRPRHQGLSHHSATILGQMTLAAAEVVVPELPTIQWATLLRQIEACGLLARHRVRLLSADHLLASLEPYRELLTTMGRTIDEDRVLFLAACAAARLALEPDAGNEIIDRSSAGALTPDPQSTNRDPQSWN